MLELDVDVENGEVNNAAVISTPKYMGAFNLSEKTLSAICEDGLLELALLAVDSHDNELTLNKWSWETFNTIMERKNADGNGKPL